MDLERLEAVAERGEPQPVERGGGQRGVAGLAESFHDRTGHLRQADERRDPHEIMREAPELPVVAVVEPLGDVAWGRKPANIAACAGRVKVPIAPAARTVVCQSRIGVSARWYASSRHESHVTRRKSSRSVSKTGRARRRHSLMSTAAGECG